MSHPQFSVVLTDPTDVGGTLDPALVSDMQAAANAWAPELSGSATLTIRLSIANLGSTGELAEGAPTTLERSGQTLDGRPVLLTAAAYALSTGRTASGSSDISITVNASVLGQLYTGTDGTVPAGQYDAVSILEHEIAHGLGFTGEISAFGVRGTTETLYDHYVQINADGTAVFTGPNAERVNGGPVTLTTLNNGENIYHVADSRADRNAGDLMSGLGLPAATVRGISALDLAMLEDSGVPVSGTAVAPAGPVVITLAGTSAAIGYTGDGGSDFVVAQASSTVAGAATGSMTVFATAGTLAFANGGGSSTVVDTGAATLSLTGGTASSRLVAFTGAAATTYHGGAGTDELIGGTGALAIAGGSAGSLVAFGGSGPLQVLGGTDSETVVGGAGAATIHAGLGAVFGGSGGSVMAAMQPGSFLVGARAGDVLNASSSGGDILAAGAGNETLNGAGAAEIDIFFGGSGADQVTLGRGGDSVIAGTGTATVQAGTGDATLFLGAGGATTLAFTAGQTGGADSVSGFRPGTDRLVLAGYAGAPSLGATGTGGTVMTLADGTRVTFQGLAPDQLAGLPTS